MKKFAVIMAWCWLVPSAWAIHVDGFEPSDLPEITAGSGQPADRHTPRPLGSTTAAQGYYEYLPPGYTTAAAEYPLLLFIHGLGENGNGDSELSRVLANGPPRLINNNSWDESRPFVVLSPQRGGGGCTSSTQIRDFIDFALLNYHINPERVYLTGLSCGAIGSWNYLRNHTNTQIAAMVPIAGDGRGAWNNTGCDLGLVPIWAFHGDADGTVGVAGTTVPINNILSCTQPPPADVSMVIYPGVGHNSWRRTYDLSAGHDIYDWLLNFRNAEALAVP
ncbi:hypothetical protein [Marinicella meishanensis]|uniref:carboxylesterase family protein n=1 Tax=Marinicella meishanensis TaxID=2873263 RepID=UPI001CBBF0C5|nr:hypothetical protein [Marinicella sp. NBU2979]